MLAREDCGFWADLSLDPPSAAGAAGAEDAETTGTATGGTGAAVASEGILDWGIEGDSILMLKVAPARLQWAMLGNGEKLGCA